VHVWLALPAGRVEVQIRTLAQSEWANVYEDFGELVGRGIRYGEVHEDSVVRRGVKALHRISADITTNENALDMIWQLERGLESLSPPRTSRDAELIEEGAEVLEKHSETLTRIRSQIGEAVQFLREVRRTMKDEAEEV
jgi:hypothetical protein